MKKLLPFLLLSIFGLFFVKSVFVGTWYSSHDGIYHAIRAKEYFKELKQGQFPVRWVGSLDEGYGLPLFNYVYPTPYFLSAIPQFLGLTETASLKIVLVGSYLAGLLGFYFLFKERSKKLAFLSAIIFASTPYIFIDLFVRCALGEFIALNLTPWALYFLDQKKYHFLSLSLLLILTSHNFIGPLFLIFILIYLFATHQLNRQSLLYLFLGLSLSAFFLVPAIFEKNFIASGNQNSFTFNYSEHFVYPQQLVYGKWDYWYSLPGPNDGMSFQLGVANILVLCLSSWLLFKTRGKNLYLSFLTISYFFLVFLMTSFSNFIWHLFLPLQMLQFPWRFLIFTTILSPLIFFETFSRFKKHSFFLALALTLLALINVRHYRRPMLAFDSSQYQQQFQLNQGKTTTVSRHEVAPRWSSQEKYKKTEFSDPNDITLLSNKTTSLSFSQPTPGQVTVLRNYFPGWQLISVTTKKKINLSPDADGNLTAFLTPDTYQLSYTGTLIEKSANLLSLFSLIVWMVLLFKPKFHHA